MTAGRHSQSCIEEYCDNDQDRWDEGEEHYPVRVDVLADTGRDGETEAENVDNESDKVEALKREGEFTSEESVVKRTPGR